MKDQERQSSSGKVRHRIFTILGAVLCVILVPILILNVTLIIKSYVDKDSVPSFGGYLPLIVLTDSMYPEIKSGDLIICHTADAEDIEVDDVISFFDPEGNGTSVVTHRVKEILHEDGTLSFRTKGDNNNTEDKMAVPAENLVGVYKNRIPGAGNCPLVFVIGDTKYYVGMNETVIDTTSLESAVKEAVESFSAEYGPNVDLSKQNINNSVSWYWAFDEEAADYVSENGQNDDKDTALGNWETSGGNAPTVTIEVTATVTQID